MSFYNNLATIVRDTLSSDLGQKVSVVISAADAYNTETGAVSATETTQEANGVVFPIGEKFIDGTLIKGGDKKLLLDAANISIPNVGDKVLIGSKPHTITLVKILAPGGVNILCTLLLRSINA